MGLATGLAMGLILRLALSPGECWGWAAEGDYAQVPCGLQYCWDVTGGHDNEITVSSLGQAPDICDNVIERRRFVNCDHLAGDKLAQCKGTQPAFCGQGTRGIITAHKDDANVESLAGQPLMQTTHAAGDEPKKQHMALPQQSWIFDAYGLEIGHERKREGAATADKYAFVTGVIEELALGIAHVE